MTNEMMQLHGLLEKSADADMLREMIGFASQRPMELEVRTCTSTAAASARTTDASGWPPVQRNFSSRGVAAHRRSRSRPARSSTG